MPPYVSQNMDEAGDAVIDTVRGWTILSGDTIMTGLNELYRPKRVVFITDVAGLYSGKPGDAGSTLVKRCIVDSAGDIIRAVDSTGREGEQEL